MPDAKQNEDSLQDKPLFANWQHVIALSALLVAIAGGGSAVYVNFFARDEARLDTEFLAEVVIAKLTSNPSGKLRLSYENEAIESASTVSLLVTNTGRTDLKPHNAQDPSDITNARIRISLAPGIRILEATAERTGEDASSELSRLDSTEPNVATFLVLLMNSDAQVKVDLIVAGVDVAETLDVAVMGEGLKGEFLRSKGKFSTVAIISAMPLSFLAGLLVALFAAWLNERRGAKQ